MAIISTDNVGINMPSTLVEGIFKDAAEQSAVLRLSAQRPQKFGNVDSVVLTERPRAEYVTEGQAKGASSAKFTTKRARRLKVQTTIRVNEEVKWADEDHQMGVMAELAAAVTESFAEAFDLGMLHARDPLTGADLTAMFDGNAIVPAAQKVTAGDKPELDIEDAVGTLLGQRKRPTGVALDAGYAYDLANSRDNNGRKLFPELGLGIDATAYAGLAAASSQFVSGVTPTTPDTGTRAIVGDWKKLAWGVQRNIPVKVIEFGDPDGQGDLQRHNQIALRAEVAYYVALMDPSAFLAVQTTPVEPAP